MNTTELQKLIESIFSNEETRQQFESNPEKVLDRFTLTKEERKAVLDVHDSLGTVVTDSREMIAAIRAHYNWFSTTGVEYYY